MTSAQAKFFPGQLIHHKRFDYRGVIVDVDPDFQGTEEWYQTMARSQPPRDKPWYHVLVDNADHMTYVAERNLEADGTAEPIKHPALGQFFERFENGTYVARSRAN
ncbi:MAG TPA: heat shock protein HspQ [Rhodospirillaceae bacterium]|nr:DNA-binding protein [Rhodospirillaceae bacterium]HAA93408.1 heat shock protein HspQ [Rhodospirillaceae bacterium]HAT35265.1 heat shock protein HspQ [Rhodospirillaceae bacterium]